MSFHVQKWLDIQIFGWTYQVKRRQIKRRGKNDGGKNRKKKKKKWKKIKKRRKKGEVNTTKGKKGRKKGEKKIERKTEGKKKEKRVGIKYLNKRKYCVGTEPSALVYLGILVTSPTTGHDGSVVSALASQAKGFISKR